MKRVFTQNKNISFNDYNNNLNGQTILKNALTHGNYYNNNNLTINNDEITNFSDYMTFLGVSKSYFRRYIDANHLTYPNTIFNATKSYVCSKNDNCECSCNNCKNQYLYPYGEFEDVKEKLCFPIKLRLPNNKKGCPNLCEPVRPCIISCKRDICAGCNRGNRLFI
jgi:hypothetical protein